MEATQVTLWPDAPIMHLLRGADLESVGSEAKASLGGHAGTTRKDFT